MPRPKKCRNTSMNPEHTYFKPAGIPKSKLEIIEIELDEYEAFKLVNIDGLSMIDGGKKLGVSAPTFNRILNSVNKKIADAIINGKAISIIK